VGAKVGEFDSVEGEKMVEEGGAGKGQTAVEETQEDYEFVFTWEGLGFLAQDSPLVFRFFREDSAFDVGDQRRGFTGGLSPRSGVRHDC
jgi:hypothetical protein